MYQFRALEHIVQLEFLLQQFGKQFTERTDAKLNIWDLSSHQNQFILP